jgi:hypothetical protein
MSTHAPKYAGPNEAKYDADYEKIDVVVSKFKASLADGFQIKDLGAWSGLVSDAYDVAKEVLGPDFTKEELTDMVCYIYWCIDPDLPWIPEPVETFIERQFIEKVAIPWAVGSAWDAVHRYIQSKK